MDIVSNITGAEFRDDFVNKGKAVLVKNALADWPAVSKWNLDYFESVGQGIPLRLKMGNVSEGKTAGTTLGEYSTHLKDYEDKLQNETKVVRPGYLHDLPIFHVLPSLKDDVKAFPVDFFPSWYRETWWNFAQFFMGGTNSFTPLHFDTLLTHNLFFQIKGTKKFLLIPADQRDLCYVYNWRWARVDAQKPDYEKHELFKQAKCEEVLVEGGDILYMPPGMLHQVHSLSFAISFNVDWHSKKSVLKGLVSPLKGAPLKNFQYNFVSALGLYLNIPDHMLFRYYKSYLNYIS